MGISFESIEDAGIFSAKGIETIRRDSPPFVVKVILSITDSFKFPFFR
jgi:hypothetical protein